MITITTTRSKPTIEDAKTKTATVTMMKNKLTVVIQTSPIPSHPSTALIEALFRSFTKADGLLESRIIILADGCEEIITSRGQRDDDDDNDDNDGNGDGKNENTAVERENIKHGKASSETASNYRQFLQDLKQLVTSQTPPFCPQEDGSIELVQLHKRYGSAPAVRVAMDTLVSTPLVMVAQHDNFFVNDAPVRQIVDRMTKNPGLNIGATCIHFLSTATLSYQQKVKIRYGLDLTPVKVTGLDYPLVPLAFWYGRTHITYSSYVREVVLNRDTPTGSHLEELLGQRQLQDIIEKGPQAHKAYGTYVLDQGIEILYHLSGRRARRVIPPEEPKNPDEMALGSTESSSSVELTNSARPTEHQSVAPPTTLLLDGAFTTARSCRAIIPGLVFPSEGKQQRKEELPKKFKGRCFNCNKRGHSKVHCPLLLETIDDRPTEIMDLS